MKFGLVGLLRRVELPQRFALQELLVVLLGQLLGKGFLAGGRPVLIGAMLPLADLRAGQIGHLQIGVLCSRRLLISHGHLYSVKFIC